MTSTSGVPNNDRLTGSWEPMTRDASAGTVASTGGGCAGECRGEAPASLRSILAGRGAQARRCYERALMQNSMLQGRMQISVRISPTGSVCSANLTQNELDPGIGNCVLGIFRSSTFPAPTGGCVDANVPLRFEPKK